MKSTVITAALLAILMPASAVADAPGQSFSVAPAEVSVDNLSPGGTAAFELTVRNQGEEDRLIVLTTFPPPPAARRPGRAEFPDDSWIVFSPQKLSVQSGREESVSVSVAIPDGDEWWGKDWEIWIGVTVEPEGVLAVAPSVRVLVSTGVPTPDRLRIALIAGIVGGAVLVINGAFYLLRRRVPRG